MLLAFLGVFGGALGFFLWTFALTRLTPTQVAVYINLNPLVAMVLAAVLLAERLTILFAAGFGAVLLGVLCWLTGRSRTREAVALLTSFAGRRAREGLQEGLH